MTAAPESYALSVEDLSVRYGQQIALQNVCIRIPRQKVTALVGPSGCGKSSFLAALNRLTDHVSGCEVKGKVILHGSTDVNVLEETDDLLTLRRRIGMVFQKPEPFPLSIRRNFELPLRECGCAKDEMEDRMESSLRQAGLWQEVRDRLSKSAVQLSGGQQQRLCIARALALQPEVLLLDEPCSALDPISSAVVEEHIQHLRESITIIIVTHNLAQARRIADEAAVFWVRDQIGALIEHGSVEQIFEDPQDEDTANYVKGAMG